MTSTCECCGQEEVELTDAGQFWTTVGAVIFGLMLPELLARRIHGRDD